DLTLGFVVGAGSVGTIVLWPHHDDPIAEVRKAIRLNEARHPELTFAAEDLESRARIAFDKYQKVAGNNVAKIDDEAAQRGCPLVDATALELGAIGQRAKAARARADANETQLRLLRARLETLLRLEEENGDSR